MGDQIGHRLLLWQFILTTIHARVDTTWGSFKVGRCTDFSGQISMETESQRAVCGGVVGGSLF